MYGFPLYFSTWKNKNLTGVMYKPQCICKYVRMMLENN
jgi:hypothetical protein